MKTGTINVTELLAEVNRLLKGSKFITVEPMHDAGLTTLEAKMRRTKDDVREKTDEIILRAPLEMINSNGKYILTLAKGLGSVNGWYCYITHEPPKKVVVHRLSATLETSIVPHDYRRPSNTSRPEHSRPNDTEKLFGKMDENPIHLVEMFIASFDPKDLPADTNMAENDAAA